MKQQVDFQLELVLRDSHRYVVAIDVRFEFGDMKYRNTILSFIFHCSINIKFHLVKSKKFGESKNTAVHIFMPSSESMTE